MQLSDLGWNSFFQTEWDKYEKNEKHIPARIVREYNKVYDIACEHGIIRAEIAGRVKYHASSKSELPAVGDWVAVSMLENEDKVVIHAVLPRKSKFSRKAIGEKVSEQIIASNIDKVFLVCALDGEYNLRRVERYLSMIWDSGASPVVVLNKSDLHPDPESLIPEVMNIAFDTPVVLTSAESTEGVSPLMQFIHVGETVAFIGSSGVGKSSIINSMLGEDRLRIGDVHTITSQGKHTTTHREMIFFPDGGMLIDTPGMREIQVWSIGDRLERVFNDVEEFADKCRFRNCKHLSEPGCALRQAVEDGELEEKRFNSYMKLREEQELLNERKAVGARIVEKKKGKKLGKLIKEFKNFKKDKGQYD